MSHGYMCESKMKMKLRKCGKKKKHSVHIVEREKFDIFNFLYGTRRREKKTRHRQSPIVIVFGNFSSLPKSKKPRLSSSMMMMIERLQNEARRHTHTRKKNAPSREFSSTLLSHDYNARNVNLLRRTF